MKWVLVLILFAEPGGADVADYKLLAGESREQCERVRDRTIANAKEAGLEIWGACVEVTGRAPAPKKPETPSGDGPQRPDGKQRGGAA